MLIVVSVVGRRPFARLHIEFAGNVSAGTWPRPSNTRGLNAVAIKNFAMGNSELSQIA
jgi:hypothetical protein